jgi:hypothetical protein
MTEAQSTQTATESDKRNHRHLYGVVVGLSVFPALVVAMFKTSIWPNCVLGFFAIGVPFLMLGIRAWKRWSRPDRLPVRWVKDDSRGKRLETLDLTFKLVWLTGFCASFVINKDAQRAHSTVGIIFVGIIAWETFLEKYIADRKYIPPPRPPHDPSKSWTSNMKPFHSEHWGQNA